MKDEVDFAEELFFDADLLKTCYMKRHREEYYHCRNEGHRLNSYRNYLSIINYFNEVYHYQKTHWECWG